MTWPQKHNYVDIASKASPDQRMLEKAIRIQVNNEELLISYSTLFFAYRKIMYYQYMSNDSTIIRENHEVLRKVRNAVGQKRPQVLKDKSWAFFARQRIARTSLVLSRYL